MGARVHLGGQNRAKKRRRKTQRRNTSVRRRCRRRQQHIQGMAPKHGNHEQRSAEHGPSPHAPLIAFAVLGIALGLAMATPSMLPGLGSGDSGECTSPAHVLAQFQGDTGIRYAVNDLHSTARMQLDGVQQGKDVQPTCVIVPVPRNSAACSSRQGGSASEGPTAQQLGFAAAWVLQHHMDTRAGTGLCRQPANFDDLADDGGITARGEAVLSDPAGRVVLVPDIMNLQAGLAFRFHLLCDRVGAPYQRAAFVFPVCTEMPEGESATERTCGCARGCAGCMRSRCASCDTVCHRGAHVGVLWWCAQMWLARARH